jgi:hypothetical protein
MSLALSKRPLFFPIDCDTDISADLVEVSLDQVTWTACTHTAPSTTVQTDYLQRHPTKGLTRYWVKVFAGPDQPIAPVYGIQTVHLRVTDNPDIPYLGYTLTVPTD